MFFIPLLLFVIEAVYLLGALSSTVDRLSVRIHEQAGAAAQLMLGADRDLYQALTAYMTLTMRSLDFESRQAYLASHEENIRQTKEQIARARQLIGEAGILDMKHERSGKSVEELLNEADNGLVSWETATKEDLEQGSSQNREEADFAFELTRTYIDQMEEVLETFQRQTIREEKAFISDLSKSMYAALIIEWIALIAAGVFIIRRINRAIAHIRHKTHQVTEGRLDLPAASRYARDELGQIERAVDGMIARMRDLIGEVIESSRAVSEGAGELAAGTQESSAAASHVAENIQEVTGLVESQATITAESGRAVEEMAAGVQRIAESAGTIAIHAADTSARARQGEERLEQLKRQMDVMTEEISRLADSVALLNDKSAEIGTIAENITAFADQTGILSLNASIEAARAGEHGRGFAVVAGEIRKLAASSLESANSIHELVSDTQREISLAGERMRSTVSQAERSAALMRDVAEGFRAITDSVHRVSGQIEEMSAVTEQMSATSEQVSASMEQAASSIREVSRKAENVAAATEEQLALAENITRSADRLRGVVDRLNGAVSRFRI